MESVTLIVDDPKTSVDGLEYINESEGWSTSNQLQEALLQFQEAFKNQDLNTRLNGIKRLVLSLNEVTHIEDFIGQEEADEDEKVVVTEELLTLSHKPKLKGTSL